MSDKRIFSTSTDPDETSENFQLLENATEEITNKSIPTDALNVQTIEKESSYADINIADNFEALSSGRTSFSVAQDSKDNRSDFNFTSQPITPLDNLNISDTSPSPDVYKNDFQAFQSGEEIGVTDYEFGELCLDCMKDESTDNKIDAVFSLPSGSDISQAQFGGVIDFHSDPMNLNAEFFKPDSQANSSELLFCSTGRSEDQEISPTNKPKEQFCTAQSETGLKSEELEITSQSSNLRLEANKISDLVDSEMEVTEALQTEEQHIENEGSARKRDRGPISFLKSFFGSQTVNSGNITRTPEMVIDDCIKTIPGVSSTADETTFPNAANKFQMQTDENPLFTDSARLNAEFFEPDYRMESIRSLLSFEEENEGELSTLHISMAHFGTAENETVSRPVELPDTPPTEISEAIHISGDFADDFKMEIAEYLQNDRQHTGSEGSVHESDSDSTQSVNEPNLAPLGGDESGPSTDNYVIQRIGVKQKIPDAIKRKKSAKASTSKKMKKTSRPSKCSISKMRSMIAAIINVTHPDLRLDPDVLPRIEVFLKDMVVRVAVESSALVALENKPAVTSRVLKYAIKLALERMKMEADVASGKRDSWLF